ncbi:hypothetical protein [Pseudonocardia sp.]|uniref:hypothetical protein n=1 Tax=Pseudonocardia sp. TaxID=60912 RepID=UPI003D112233
MITIATTDTTARRPARRSNDRPELVWVVDINADGESILVARWSVSDLESRARAEAA